MTSRIQSDLLLVDGALRSCPSRALLKAGSFDAWAACNTSLQAVLSVLHESVLADQQGGSAAAVSMLWRKSSASKKLLALLRAVVEEAHALQGEAAHACAAARTVRCRAVHGSISVISFFWPRTQQSTTLWPAMREWIAELGGIKSVWTALAWLVSLPTQYFEAADHRLLRESAHSVIALTYCLFGLRRPVELSQHAAVTTALGSVLGNMLPRDFAAGNADMWDVRVVFHAIAALCQLEYVMEPEHLNDMFYNVTSLQQLEGCTLAAHLHKPLLVFWPHLVAEMRRQHRCLQESTGESPPPGNGLPSLKVRGNAGYIHSRFAFAGFSGSTFCFCYNVSLSKMMCLILV